MVFLAGCERGLLPLRLAGPLTAADAAEERRLLFVGMTRARDRLLLTCAAHRTRHGSPEAAGRSPFLTAVHPELPGLTGPRRRAGPPTASCACSRLCSPRSRAALRRRPAAEARSA